MYEHEIDMKMRELPDRMKGEVLDYIEFLLSKCGKHRNKGKKFSFDWEGGLADIKDRTSSVEMQHRSLEWR